MNTECLNDLTICPKPFLYSNAQRCVSDGVCLDVFLPAGCLQEVSEELLVAREGWGRTGTNDSTRLNETLFKTLQTPQAVSSQHAQQVGVRGIAGGVMHTGTFTHLEKLKKKYIEEKETHIRILLGFSYSYS